MTIELADVEARIPSTSGVAVCVEPGGLPGLPRIDRGPTSTDLVVVGGGSGSAGYVVVRYTIDGASTEHRAPIPGTGPSSDVCAASIGTDTRDDCLAKVTFDDDIIPTLPPTPSVPPTPTVPPTPSVPPTPTLPPTPEPDPFCHRSTCIPYGGSVLQEPYDRLQERIQGLTLAVDCARRLGVGGPYVYQHPSTGEIHVEYGALLDHAAALAACANSLNP